MSDNNITMRWQKKFGLALTSVIIASLFSLLLGELALRLLLKDQIVMFPRYHSSAQYGEFNIRRFRPNTVFWHTSIDGRWKFTINNQGFRNSRDFRYEKTPGVLRILSLGDSQTAGFEVRQDHTFSSVIERALVQRGTRAEVINAGVSGFSTAEELVLLENEGIKYKPDVVVLGFFANDFEDNTKAGLFALKENKIVIQKKNHIPGVRILDMINEFGMFRWLSENSYLYSFALNSVWNLAKQLLKNRTQAKLETEYAVPVGQTNDYQVALVGRLIERMYAFCRKSNINLIILDIPRRSNSGNILSSIPPTLIETMRLNSDDFIYSKDLLREYRQRAEFHVPHGHHHISEFTHRIYGVATARSILKMVKRTAGSS